MDIDARRTAVLALHWQVNVIEPEGWFGPMLAEPVRRSCVVDNAVRFHDAARARGVPVYFTRFVIPPGDGLLVRNTGFMEMVGTSADAFRPDAPGASLIAPMRDTAAPGQVVDNQKLSGLAGNDLHERLVAAGIDTVVLTGVATNLTVEQTARHATDLGLHVLPVRDCVAAAEPSVHDASLANLALVTRAVVTASEVEQALR